MKKLVNIALGALRISIVAVALLALAVSGAGAAQRLYVEQTAPKAAPTVPSVTAFESKPDPAEATGGMAGGSRPSTEQSFWIQSPSVLPAGGGQSLRMVACPAAGSALSGARVCGDAPVCRSVGRVATQIGHRFTLVGERPSGTS